MRSLLDDASSSRPEGVAPLDDRAGVAVLGCQARSTAGCERLLSGAPTARVIRQPSRALTFRGLGRDRWRCHGSPPRAERGGWFGRFWLTLALAAAHAMFRPRRPRLAPARAVRGLARRGRPSLCAGGMSNGKPLTAATGASGAVGTRVSEGRAGLAQPAGLGSCEAETPLGMSSRSITSSEGRPRVVPPRHVRKAVTDSVVGVNEALAGGYPQAATWAGPPLAPSLSATARCLRVEGGLWSPMLIEMAGIDGTGAFQRARTPAQKQQRREAILAAARALALGRGVGNVTLAAIAEEVGLAKSNVLSYFGTLDAIYLQLVNEEWRDWVTVAAARLTGATSGPAEVADALSLSFAERSRTTSPPTRRRSATGPSHSSAARPRG